VRHSAVQERRVTANPKIFQGKTSESGTSGTVRAGVDSPGPVSGQRETPAGNRIAVPATHLDLWLHRITVLLFVFVCAVVGVLLIILPWRPEWTDNRLLLMYPSLRAFVANGFVRGVCSGLGMLDIWIGFWEAIHYHEGEHA
jgi:hypothetical protein